jgi:nicotinamidase-related amidase
MSSAETRTLYRTRGLGGRVGFGVRPALLVVDLINGFTDPRSPLGSALDAEVEATRRLLDASRAAGAPVHFTTIEYAEGCPDAGVFIRKITALAVLRAGSPYTVVDARIAPRPDEIVWSKKQASAFFGTALAATLTAQRVDTLFIAGATTSGCVRASAVDACQHGFRTIVVREAVGDRAPEPHAANLFDIDSKYGDVVPLAEALAYLARVHAGTASAAGIVSD